MTPKKQKIIYVITKSNWGGSQRYVYDLASSLSHTEFEVSVVLGGTGLLKEKLSTSTIATLPVSELQRDISVVKEIRSFFSLYGIFRKSRPDIVHLNSSKAGALGALAARIAGVRRIIFTAHGWPFNEKRGHLWNLLTWLASYVTALLSTDVIVITSLDCKQAKAMPFVRTKIHLIPNGIKMPDFLSREEARSTLNLPHEATVIGSIGELTRNKNYPELITVAAGLYREHLDFKLVIIGEGEDRVEITSGIKNNLVIDGRVIVDGFREDAQRYLKAFDIFVLNSRKEGLPYVILEAGAAGLPVAATAVGGIPDIVENDKTGLLVPPYKMDEALRKLITEKETREKLGDALKDRVEKTFSFERMLRETLLLYTS
ncbi:MAG: glycosyltransferase [bacterium]|nr:glycosyltransferase [bacterium]